jgi:DNA-binding SARP family transcriptional activator
MIPPHLSLILMGQFQLTLDGQIVRGFESDKVRALLAYLAVESDRAHTRSALAALLWPHYPEENARANLRRALHQLRQLLGDTTAAEPFLLITRQAVQLRANAPHTVDVAAFRALLGSQQAHDHTRPSDRRACVQLLHQATQLYHGNFLADLVIPDSPPFEHWRHSQQEQLHIQALDSLSLLAELYAADGDDAQAQHCARRQLQLEPWRELAHQQLMRALARSGQRAAAIGQFHACQQVLAAELGIAPDATTVALYEQIRSDKLAPQLGSPPQAAALPDNARRGIPETGPLYGRDAELAQLQGWLLRDRARVVALLGMGGIGKTALAATAANAAGAHYDAVIWHSLLNAPSPDYLLRATLHALPGSPEPTRSAGFDELLWLLLTELRRRRCLLVFDGMESILEAYQAGAYRAGYEQYRQLIQLLAANQHHSCLLLTSREQPDALAELEADALPVRSLRVAGLDTAAAQALFKARGLARQAIAAGVLATRYSGNPLALKQAAQTVHELFGGDTKAFLAAEAPIFGAIRAVLDQQFTRLTELEREILTWLAIERGPTSMSGLRANLVDAGAPHNFIEALRALQCRSLLEQGAVSGGQPEQSAGAPSPLQHIIIEYAIDRLVEDICQEIADGRANVLHRHALFKASARGYVRQNQERRIVQPIAERLSAQLGLAGLESQLRYLLATVRSEAPGAPGYAASNIIALLLEMGADPYARRNRAVPNWKIRHRPQLFG